MPLHQAPRGPDRVQGEEEANLQGEREPERPSTRGGLESNTRIRIETIRVMDTWVARIEMTEATVKFSGGHQDIDT